MGASSMKKKIIILPVAAMWGCTDYVGQWDDQYGAAFAQPSNPSALVCVEGTTTSLVDENNCETDFLCVDNAWIPQNFVCNGQTQQKICDEGVTTYVVDGTCTTYFLCANNTWTVLGVPQCYTPVVYSSSSMKRSSSSVKPTSSAARSSSSKAKSSSSMKISTAFPTWYGRDGIPRVETGLDNGNGSSGYWYAYADEEDGGQSKIEWPAPLGNDYNNMALDNVIEYCNGVCGTAMLEKGTLTYNPFVGIAFDVAGQMSKTENTLGAANASAWGGVCITYTSEAAPSLQLGLGDFDREIGFANPAASLPKSTAGTMKNLAWSDFKQPTWYKGATKIDGEDAAKRLVTLKFLIQAAAGSYKFNVCAIGPYNGGCPQNCN